MRTQKNPKTGFKNQDWSMMTPSIADINKPNELAAYWLSQAAISALIGASNVEQCICYAREALQRKAA